GASTHPGLSALSAKTTPDAPETADLKRKLLLALGITVGICALAFLAGLGADFASPIDAQLQQQGFPLDALRQDRAALLRADVLRSVVFITLAAGTLWFYLQRRLPAGAAAALVGIFTLVDLWTVDKRYLNEANFQTQTVAQQFVPSAADQQILQDKDLSYRVLNTGNPFNEAQTSYFHKSIGGYNGAKLRRYQELIERQISRNNMQVLNMLNTRYLIQPAQPGQQQGQPGTPEQAQRNPGALGNAWFVSEIQQVQTPDQEINALTSLNAATTAVVDAAKFPLPKTRYNAPGSTIILTKYAPDALTYRATATADAFVVFSEIYYADGWNAYLDGQKVPYVRANYVLRALPLPAGPHTIEFRFEPTEYAIGNTVSLVSSGLLLVALLGAVGYAVRRRPALA
ncbi:MAG: YfhO family protein, partial [Hymenobacter sp.]|nr:YfhO family protein [Hymenobacter sp.]